MSDSRLYVGGDFITAGGKSSLNAAYVSMPMTADSTTTVASGLNPSTYGASVTFTATVSPSDATGTVTFKDGATTLGTGTLSGGTATYSTSDLSVSSHTITAEYAGDSGYAASAASPLTQTVNKATPTVTTWPTASAITYGQTLASSTLSGGSSTPAGSFAWTTSTTAPNAGTASQSVTFTPTDTTNYNTTADTVSVTVSKATPTVTLAVNNSPATYDGIAKSATVTISASSTPGSVANILTGGAASQTAADTYAVTANFVPTNTNYNTLAAESAGNFDISKATPSITTWPTASAITYGQTLASSILSGGSSTPAGSFAWTTPTTAPGVGTALQAVTFTPADAANYATASGTVSVTVNPVTRTPTKSGAWDDPATWGGTVPVPGENVVLPAGITVTLAGPIGPFANLTIAGTLNLGTNTIQVSGNLTITGTFNPGTGTVALIGDANQELTATAPGTLTFYKLRINKSSATAKVTAKSKLKASKRLTITKGKLVSASDYGDVLIETDGTLELTSDITIAGDLVVLGDGTLTTDGHKVTFDGGVVQNLTLEFYVVFADLTVTAGTTLVETESPNNVGLGGTLLNQGVIRKLQVLDETEYYNFGLAGNYAAADMEIHVTDRTGGTPLTAIQVDRIDANHPQAPGTNTTGIYWTITPTGSGFVANVVLPQDALADPQVCRYRNSAWDWARSGFDPNTVTRTGLTAFGDFAVFDTPSPQLIPPTAVADPVTRSAQGLTKIAVAQLLLNDSDPLGRTLTLSSVSAGSGGTVALSGRWITFTPDVGLADGTPATFTYPEFLKRLFEFTRFRPIFGRFESVTRC